MVILKKYFFNLLVKVRILLLAYHFWLYKNAGVCICICDYVDERGFDQAIICQRLLLLKLESAAVILQILILSHLALPQELSQTHKMIYRESVHES